MNVFWWLLHFNSGIRLGAMCSMEWHNIGRMLLSGNPAQQLPSAHPFGTCWHLTTLLSWASIWLQHFRPLTCRPVAIFSVAACFRMLSSGQWDPSLQTKMTIWHMKASDLPGIQIGFQMFLRSMLSLEEKNSPDNVFVDNYLKG